MTTGPLQISTKIGIDSENLNALFIQEKVSQAERLQKLNRIAIQQMRLLESDTGMKKLEAGHAEELA